MKYAMNLKPEMSLLQLSTIVLSEVSLPDNWKCLPTYLLSETLDNEQSVLKVGEDILCSGGGPVYIIDDADLTNNAYPGALKWKKALERSQKCHGIVNHDNIKTITLASNTLLNTLTESLAVATIAQKEKWSSLTIVAPPFHQLRVFISMVTAAHFVGYQIRIYNKVGVTLPWYVQARHSQGTLIAKRSDLILSEIARILKYQKDSIPIPLLSTEKVLKYLEWRDSW